MSKLPPSFWREHVLKRGIRFIYTVFCFLPALVLFLFFLPKFEPTFRKLGEKGELPTLSKYACTMSIYDRQSCHVFSLLALLGLLALDEVMFQIRRQFGSQRVLARLWFTFVFLGGLCTGGMLLFAVLAPVFKMSDSVALRTTLSRFMEQ